MRKARSNKPRRLADMIYSALFQQVPFNIAVIDRNHNIIDANDNFARRFGDWRGKKCYNVYRKLHRPCDECPSAQVFEDGRVVVADAVGIDQYGKQTHYVGHVAPIRTKENGPVDYVLEMTRTVTGTKSWQQEYQVLFDRVPCYITVIDQDYRILRANEAFRKSFGDELNRHCYEVYKRRKTKCPNCPASRTFKDGQVHHSQQTGIRKGGEKTHYVLSTSPLSRSEGDVAHVIEISTDITETKRLEEEVIDAERLAAVGQTVAGLAHSIKNILMGLEGGMYIVRKALKKDNKEMLSQGWEMLERNFDKTTSLVKDFLSFSKGRLPELKMVNPNDLVWEIIDLYKDIAKSVGVILTPDIDSKIKKAPLDPKGIHTCLTNLVSNAIDACQMSEKKDCCVYISTKDIRGAISFIVKDDGCGIDHDIKSKIFTTFFTTKGGKGTGLGLLTTRKIVQEHGGKITVHSKKGEGTKFTMAFPRKRLHTLFKNSKIT
jgi:PAS domain S-box-containing protein